MHKLHNPKKIGIQKCRNSEYKIWAKFLKLINKHFPPSNPLSQIINRKTVKMSYRCTENMAKMISSHNSKILREQNLEETRTCSCTNKEECPLGGQCLLEDIIYQATVTPLNMDEGEDPTPNNNLDEGENPTPDSDLDEGDDPTPTISGQPETYVGLCSTNFKARLSNHNTTFKYASKSGSTSLSRHIWKLKRRKIKYNLEWKILDRGQQYSPISGICSLCTCEKFHILYNREKATLNQKTEIFGHCLHRKYKLLDKVDKKKSPGT